MSHKSFTRFRAISVAIFVIGAVSAGFAYSLRDAVLPRAVQTVPVVTNRTKAIKIIENNVTPNGIIEVTLLNQSSRIITFYTFAIGEGRITPLGGIEPGATTVQKFSMSNFESGVARSQPSTGELTIVALSFGGGGGEGEPEEVSKLEETTLGMKEQIEMFLPALERVANSPTVESEDSIRSFDVEVAQLSVKGDKRTFSAARRGGQDLAKLLISRDLQSLKDRKRMDPDKTYRKGLAERLAYYQRRLAEL